MIDKLSLYETWAPPDHPWSGWVKPVLFAHWPRELPKLGAFFPCDVSWAPPPSEGRAILVELPGVEAVAMGMALAEVGYRPVPMFSGSPPPSVPRHPLRGYESPATVDVESILAALVRGAETLKESDIASTAPPAFLIDERRSTLSRPLLPGVYDNRSWVYTTDFPTAGRLTDEGVTGLVVHTAARGSIAKDLEHILRVWAREGLAISETRAWRDGPPEPLELKRPSWFAGITFWLRRLFVDPTLGHGSFVSQSSS